MFKHQNTVFYDYQSRFLVIFSSNYRHRLVLKIPFPDHIFPKISKYRTEILLFPSSGKNYAPLPALLPPPPPTNGTWCFQNTTIIKTSIYDLHKMVIAVMKIYYNEEKARIIQYRSNKNFREESFKTGQNNMNF